MIKIKLWLYFFSQLNKFVDIRQEFREFRSICPQNCWRLTSFFLLLFLPGQPALPTSLATIARFAVNVHPHLFVVTFRITSSIRQRNIYFVRFKASRSISNWPNYFTRCTYYTSCDARLGKKITKLRLAAELDSESDRVTHSN